MCANFKTFPSLPQIDIPLNILFYKWLLNEQPTMNVADIQQLDPTFSTSIFQMYKILLRKSKMVMMHIF